MTLLKKSLGSASVGWRSILSGCAISRKRGDCARVSGRWGRAGVGLAHKAFRRLGRERTYGKARSGPACSKVLRPHDFNDVAARRGSCPYSGPFASLSLQARLSKRFRRRSARSRFDKPAGMQPLGASAQRRRNESRKRRPDDQPEPVKASGRPLQRAKGRIGGLPESAHRA